jgi:hypothetical protein
MGLFRERAPPAKEGNSLKERWHAWIAQEKLRRLAWAVYVRVLSLDLNSQEQPAYVSGAGI